MIIIHHMNENTLPRLAAGALRERLRVMPAVIVSGARQAGKSTLVQEPVAGKRHYATLDDLDVCDLVRRDPMALVGGETRLTIDEVQREPLLLRSIKRAIDKQRVPGRFLLAGSASWSPSISRHDASSAANNSGHSPPRPAPACSRRVIGQSVR